MDDKNKNVIDKFLEGYEDYNERKVVYKKVYEKPGKVKTIVGFIFSFGFLLLLIRFFLLKPFYFFLLIGDILALVYFSLNLFTKKGFGLPKMVAVVEEKDKTEETKEDVGSGDDQDEYWNRYR